MNNALKNTRRGDFQKLPGRARELALHQLSNARNPPGPGDGYLYEWTEEHPPFFYIGPLPYVTALRRLRRLSYHTFFQ